GESARDRRDEREREQDHRGRAGESGRAVERLQQDDRIRAIEEARDEIRELELADRQRRYDDQAREYRLPQRRQHDMREALPAAAAERFGRVLERAQSQPLHVGDDGLQKVGQRKYDMPGG